MITELCLRKINEYDDECSRWRLANNILYEMVSKYPKHDDADVIVAKLSIIGRTYAAAVERRKNKANTLGDFYYDYVAPQLFDSEIDDKIDSLRKHKKITKDNLPDILSVHYYLMNLFEDSTEMRKRSLASKYLHFHLPELFFIYDSRTESVITQFSGRLSRVLDISQTECDKTYATFCSKALIIYNALNDKNYTDPQTRVVDNILSRYCDEIERKKQI